MPYPLVNPTVVEIRIVGTLAAQRCITTFHYVTNTAEDDGRATIQSALTVFEEKVWNVLRGTISQDYLGVRLEGQSVWPLRYQTVTITPDVDAGGVGSAACPSGTAVVIRRKGDLASRKTRGRVFLPGVPFASTLNSSLNAAYMTANAANFRAAMLEPLLYAVDSAMNPVIWSAKDPTNRTRITDALLDPILRYQRRREVGVGQ